jgi:hypothetical protein
MRTVAILGSFLEVGFELERGRDAYRACDFSA